MFEAGQQSQLIQSELMHALIQETYAPHHYAPSEDSDGCYDIQLEDFYDAPSSDECKDRNGRKDVTLINIDPSERLINAVISLRDVVMQNTVAQLRGKNKHKPGPSPYPVPVSGTPSQTKSSGVPGLLKDEIMKKPEKVLVEIRVVFLKVGEIDTLKEQYHADTFIQAKWREPCLDKKSPEELKRVELEKFWNPLLYIDNILNEQKECTWLCATLSENGEAYVVERRRVKGIFLETLELNDFPLDVQDLTITVTSERPDSEIDLTPDQAELCAVNIASFTDQQWSLHEHVEVTRKVLTQEFSHSSKNHPALSVTCRAARRPGFFYWNVFLVMFFISALSFATFSVQPHLPQNRLQLSFTLLLTCIAFKFVINQSLPKISYLTYMDKYVLMSLIELCVVCIWHAVVAILDPGDMHRIERIVLCTFVGIYVACHVVFILWLYFDACKRRRIMKRKDAEYLEFIQRKLNWSTTAHNSRKPKRHNTREDDRVNWPLYVDHLVP